MPCQGTNYCVARTDKPKRLFQRSEEGQELRNIPLASGYSLRRYVGAPP